jgi:hypothetical protein
MTTASDGTARRWRGRNLWPNQLLTAQDQAQMPHFAANARRFQRVLNSHVAPRPLRRHGYEHPAHIGDSRCPVEPSGHR